MTYDSLLVHENARAMFNVRRQQFNKKRAIREVAKRFNTTQANVRRASYYW